MASGNDLPPGYTLRTGYPTIPAYRQLRVLGKLSAMSEEQSRRAHAGSWHGYYITYTPPTSSETITIEEEFASGEGDIVGMGRLIGDGGWYFCVADIAVHPSHRRKGLGDVIVKALLQYIKENAPEKAFVTLSADPPGVGVYKRNGFQIMADRNLTGMYMVT
ncbi:putative GNAT family acetyltransferase [Cylindrobasidium torrendii FP15055 ss-10]|uniref:Putative GNAT family acetyltransferase n=1 Tax=Cylindrobasidium torrendii FP15055 ss-10 TaxID=1314674 RepID=A0A0D7AZM3_9AGAR|nr:putative GNAT family acetyltransferase [Cylindrobasidium torrendii FP15055 ss-10]